jgi:hypothetical protein
VDQSKEKAERISIGMQEVAYDVSWKLVVVVLTPAAMMVFTA